MDKLTRISTLFLFWFIIISHQILTAAGEGGQRNARDETDRPYLATIMTDTISLLKRSHKSSWDKVKTIIHDLQLQLTPPNLDFRSSDEASAGNSDGAGQKVKEAVQKSFEASKMTVEETAKSVGKAVEDTVQTTAEKVKNSVSDKQEPHDEL